MISILEDNISGKNTVILEMRSDKCGFKDFGLLSFYKIYVAHGYQTKQSHLSYTFRMESFNNLL